MATLTVAKANLASVAVPFQPAEALDKLAVGQNLLLVKNDGATDVTVTIESFAPARPGYEAAPLEAVVTAGTTEMIGPLNNTVFADPDDGQLQQITYSSTADVEVAAISL